MTKQFSGQVVVVTGASRGIGRAVALAFADRGAALVLAARSVERLNGVAEEIGRLGAEVVVAPTDMTSPEQVTALVETTMDRFGRIDILVNNAGIATVAPVESALFAGEVRRNLQASLFGAIALTQQVLPIMRRQGSGTIVNMSSVMGRKAFARFGSYAITMHAVSAFSDALRQELAGTGIEVSVIHPALTATDLLRDVDEAEMPPPFRHMTPLTSEDVARAVIAAVRHRKRRVVLPRNANTLLLGEALSPRIGDRIASALTKSPIAKLLGVSRGVTYHQMIGADTGTPVKHA